jgi:hypothetical protein
MWLGGITPCNYCSFSVFDEGMGESSRRRAHGPRRLCNLWLCHWARRSAAGHGRGAGRGDFGPTAESVGVCGGVAEDPRSPPARARCCKASTSRGRFPRGVAQSERQTPSPSLSCSPAVTPRLRSTASHPHQPTPRTPLPGWEHGDEGIFSYDCQVRQQWSEEMNDVSAPRPLAGREAAGVEAHDVRLRTPRGTARPAPGPPRRAG